MMRASQLISMLQAFIAEHGDLPVIGTTNYEGIGERAIVEKEILFSNEDGQPLYLAKERGPIDEDPATECCVITFEEGGA